MRMSSPAAALGLALLSFGSLALAQLPSAPPLEAREARERPFSKPTERVEARLAYVKTALKIEAHQLPQWEAYAALIRGQAKEMEARMARFRTQHAPTPPQRPTAIERLERRQSMHAQAIASLNALLAVQKPLYAALSSEQQKIADVVLAQGLRGPGGRFERLHPHPGGRMGPHAFQRG